ENAAKPPPAMLDGLDELLRDTTGTGILSGQLISVRIARNVTIVALEGDVARDLVRLAVAATTYKAKHGKYPGTLSELVPEFVPEVPADPFDGRPMRLRREGDGVVLYSIGRDRKDDGGRPYERGD